MPSSRVSSAPHPSLGREVRELLRRYDLRPRKALAQHFLVDGRVLRTVLAAADLVPTDTVVEVGPGLGILTSRLGARAGRVVAVELDPALADLLRERLASLSNLKVIQGDILQLPSEEIAGGQPYKVVANLPYSIAAAAIRHFLEATHRPQLLVVMVQREVAENICAVPGTLGLLGLSVQVYGRPRTLLISGPRSFYPPPGVDSAVIRIDVYPEPIVPTPLLPHFFAIARAGFSAPRKQLRNSLAQGLKVAPAEAEARLRHAEINPQRRPHTLSLSEWVRLAALSPQVQP